jgi:hypothetical protein
MGVRDKSSSHSRPKASHVSRRNALKTGKNHGFFVIFHDFPLKSMDIHPGNLMVFSRIPEHVRGIFYG